MSHYHTELEELEKVKDWWKKYGVSTVCGVVIGLIFMFAWQYWMEYKQEQTHEASRLYSTMMDQYAKKELDATKQNAQTLKQKFASTPYSEMASLLLANLAIAENNLNLAQEELEWTNRHAKPAVLKEIARIRLARVLAALGKSEDALRLLGKNEEPVYAPLADEIRGDILVASNQEQQAKKAYEQAISLNTSPSVSHPFLQMKYDNLSNVGA